MAERNHIIELENVFLQTIRQMGRVWAHMLPAGMTPTQFRILKNLHFEGPQMVSTLADSLFITSGAVTGIADKLIHSGYATRQRSEEDRRVVYLSITENGSRLVVQLTERRQAMIQTLFADLADEDIRHMTRIMQHLSSNIDQQLKEKS